MHAFIANDQNSAVKRHICIPNEVNKELLAIGPKEEPKYWHSMQDWLLYLQDSYLGRWRQNGHFYPNCQFLCSKSGCSYPNLDAAIFSDIIGRWRPKARELAMSFLEKTRAGSKD